MTIFEYFEKLVDKMEMEEVLKEERLLYDIHEDPDRQEELIAWQDSHPQIDFQAQTEIEGYLIDDLELWCDQVMFFS